MRSNVCLLTPNQAFQLESKGIVPSCREHRHISRAKANALVEEIAVYRDDAGNFIRLLEVRWIGKGKRYLVFVRSRNWERRDSAGMIVMQLVPGGGAL